MSTLVDETTYIPTDISELLGCKKPLRVGDPVRCKKRFEPDHWTYAQRGFSEGKLCWIENIEEKEGKIYYHIKAEQFEVLQPSEDILEDAVFKEHFEKTRNTRALTEREAKLVTIIKLCREDYLGLVVFCRENGWDRTGKDAQESVDYIDATLKSLGIEGEE